MTGQIPEAEEVVKMSDLPLEEPEQEILVPHETDNAMLGDVLMQGVTQLIPEGWHECDGSTHPAYRYPDFVAHMKIRDTTFTLPEPLRTLPGHRFIIKLGRPVQPPVQNRDPLGLGIQASVPEKLVLPVETVTLPEEA